MSSTLLVVVASVRPTRVGGAVADWAVAHARARSDFEVKVADLRALALPVMDEPNHPRLREYEYEHTKRWSAIVDDADGFVFVMPEYNHSYPGAFKNALDYLYLEWQGKPVGIVSYGGLAGGTRGVVALQPVLANFAMIGLKSNVEIQWVGQRIDDDGAFRSDARTDAVIEAQLDELTSLLRRLAR